MVGLGLNRESRLAEQRADEIAALAGELDEEGVVGREIHGRRVADEIPESHEKTFVSFPAFVGHKVAGVVD